MASQTEREQPAPSINWVNLIFLTSVHAIAILGTIAYALIHGFTWAAGGIAVIWFMASGFSISGGYHRLFSHRSYEAHPFLRAFVLFFGAAQFQNSALKWSADHRRHHAKVDTDEDPYSIKRGFWWAHVGWVLHADSEEDLTFDGCADLIADPLVMFQHRHYVTMGALMGFVLPALIGYVCGDLWGGLILAGFLRLALMYQLTFSVNSLAHYVGTQPYTDANSSRDSLLTVFVTMGEGFHNFHHAFQTDYRNGVRWWHFDPTKWIVCLFSWVGVTRNLKRTAQFRIQTALRAMRAKMHG